MKHIKLEKITELKNLDPSRKLFTQLVGIFFSETKARLPEMKNYVTTKDFASLAKVTHRFRSTAYNLGATHAAEITKTIDVKIAQSEVDVDEVMRLILELETECYAAYGQLTVAATAA